MAEHRKLLVDRAALRGAADTPLQKLTKREYEAVRMYLEQGHRGRAASKLGISENTLKSQLASARRKLQMPDHVIAGLIFPDRAGPHPRRVNPPHPRRVNPEWVMEERAPPPLSGSPPDDGSGGDVPLEGERISPILFRWSRRNDLTTKSRLIAIAHLTVAIFSSYVLAFAVFDGMQRVADQLNPISHPR
ncbi:hypothetical protein [Sphingomonas sp. TZW2008]|uniref:hypothetical protein n=1 Tax=Sphingomonas sp. TZW2008 TaxID=1917973 RepID=UPI0011818595|nr:hypothetical protein [Sphingomonas sp. TZW2008]